MQIYYYNIDTVKNTIKLKRNLKKKNIFRNLCYSIGLSCYIDSIFCAS